MKQSITSKNPCPFCGNKEWKITVQAKALGNLTDEVSLVEDHYYKAIIDYDAGYLPYGTDTCTKCGAILCGDPPDWYVR